MRFIARRIQLNNGQWCVLRSPEPEEAAQRIAYLRKVNGETDFMARGTADSPSDEALVMQILADQLDDEGSLEISAWLDGKMVACGGIGRVSSGYPRKRHRAQLGVSVLRECWNLGIGSAILRALIDAAPGMGYLQIELSVVEDNARAIALYRRMGFRETGRIPRALRYGDGSFRDEIWMIKNTEADNE